MALFQWFLTQGTLGNIKNDKHMIVTRGESRGLIPSIELAESRDTAKHTAMHRTAPNNKELFGSKCQKGEVENACVIWTLTLPPVSCVAASQNFLLYLQHVILDTVLGLCTCGSYCLRYSSPDIHWISFPIPSSGGSQMPPLPGHTYSNL